MTLYVADIASYQGALSLAGLTAAGFGGINVKVSHGLGQKSVHPAVGQYVADARAQGMALSAFHWLTSDAGGVAQADYCFRQLALHGLTPAGAAVVCDVETDGVTVDIYQGFVARLTELLGRRIVTYTGDWYAAAREWVKASEASPWLWSAPGPGYQPAYPGDASELWETGYAGWNPIGVMQYRVAPVDGIDVSQSAVRDLELWAEMTGVEKMATLAPCLVTLRDEFNKLNPDRDKSSDGWIGDAAHQENPTSDHNPDADGVVHAIDVDEDLKISGTNMQAQIDKILKRCRKNNDDPDNEPRLKYIIYEKTIWDAPDWKAVKYTGSNPHDKHAHFSCEYDSEYENDTGPWGLLEDEMTEADFKKWMTNWANSSDGKKALGYAMLTFDPGNNETGETNGGVKNPDYDPVTNKNATVGTNYALERALIGTKLGYEIRDKKLPEILDAVEEIQTVNAQEVADLIIAALPEAALTAAQVEQCVRNVLLNGAATEA